MTQQSVIAPSRSRLLWTVAFVLMALLSLGVAGYALSYLSGRDFPEAVRDNLSGRGFLVAHAACAAIALITGPWQFMPRLRARRRAFHRWNGRLYAVACVVGGLFGLALAWNVTSGDLARSGFFLLAVLWLGFTARGWQLARKADYAGHRPWMIRSFALALGAVTLRIQLGLCFAAGLAFPDFYPWLAWTSWVPNLILAEWWIRRSPRIRI